MYNDVVVSIIIVNYNTCELTYNCISSIYEYVRFCKIEIILVDNASTDNSLEYIKEKFPEVILIASKINLGFGRANNLGAKHAHGEYLFLLNSDTILKNDPFPLFLDFFKNNNLLKIGILGTFLIDGQGTYSKSGGKFYSMKKYLKLALLSYFPHKTINEIDIHKNVITTDYVIGADMFLRKDLFSDIGRFDEHIFMYFEDVELCKRLAKNGYVSFLIKGNNIIHYVNSSSTSQFSRIYNTASLLYCIRKESNSIIFFLFQLTYFILKFPILFKRPRHFNDNWSYLKTIFCYKKYVLY